MKDMFKGCDKLKYVSLPKFIDKTIYYMGSMFYNCKSLKSLDMSMINTRYVEQIESIFSGCVS
jgi:surface protein